MHDIFSISESVAQNNDEEDIRCCGQPVDIEHPQADLEKQPDDSEGHRKAEAWLGKEETVPIGLHRPHGEG